jgi:hypothetical protein
MPTSKAIFAFVNPGSEQSVAAFLKAGNRGARCGAKRYKPNRYLG